MKRFPGGASCIQPAPSTPDPQKPDIPAKPSVPPKEGLSDFDIVMEKIALEMAPDFWSEREKK